MMNKLGRLYKINYVQDRASDVSLRVKYVINNCSSLLPKAWFPLLQTHYSSRIKMASFLGPSSILVDTKMFII